MNDVRPKLRNQVLDIRYGSTRPDRLPSKAHRRHARHIIVVTNIGFNRVPLVAQKRNLGLHHTVFPTPLLISVMNEQNARQGTHHS